jgi:hypothetical protein
VGKVKKDAEVDPFAEWRAIQLTPEQKAAARAESQKLIDKAAEEGAYEELLALQGKVNLDLDLEELRKDRD